MVNHIMGIDHAIVGVRDLAHARTTYERLGFHVTPQGRHVGWGTANYCLMFPADYVELLGIVDPEQFTNNLDRFLETREGLLSLALRSANPEGTHEAWRSAGLEPAEVSDLSRLLETEVELRFKNVVLAPATTGELPLLACSPLTPELMRKSEWLDHPNGAVGIESITVVLDDPATLIPPMAKVFGATNLTETDDTLAVHTGHGVLLLTTPDGLSMLHPEMDAIGANGTPQLAALTLTVKDTAETAAELDRREIAYRRDVGGTIGVSPEHTHGVMLEFTAAAGLARAAARLA